LKLTGQSEVASLKEAQESSAHEHAQAVASLQTKIEHLEAQLRDKECDASEQHAKSAQEVAQLKAQEQKLQDKLQAADQESTGLVLHTL
jgi:uncharacterized small protein (DUF1192 family)